MPKKATVVELVFSLSERCDADVERRFLLRSFLTRMRSRLRPEEVGLPRVERRRVPGLRCQEVAELVGISDVWYRLLESGRAFSVSPRLLARLAEALRLNAVEEVTLFRLALPELYNADARLRLMK